MIKRKIISKTELVQLYVLLTLATLFVGPASAQILAGSISRVNGKAIITRGKVTIPAASGVAVYVGDRVVTEADGNLTITLSDASQIELAESSTLTINENTLDSKGTRASTKLSLLNGLVRSVVSTVAGQSPNFEVHTPNAVAAVRGTDFDVDHETGVHENSFPGCAEFTHVSVAQGTVEVSNSKNPNAPSTEVKKGHKATVPCSGAIVVGAAAAGLSSLGHAGIAGAAVVGAGAAAAAGVAVGGGFGGGGDSNPPVTPPEKP